MLFLPQGFTFPSNLADNLANYFWHTSQPSNTQISEFARSLQELWPRLAKSRGQEKQSHYGFSQAMTEIYAAYYLPANIFKVPLVLAEAECLGLSILRDDQKTIWFDVGAGPATVALGLKWWQKERNANLEIYNLDQSKEFLQVGRSLTAKILPEYDFPIFFERIDSDKKKSHHSLKDSLKNKRPHIVSFSNSIAEIFPNLQERAFFLNELIETMQDWSKTDKRSRWLLLVEPAAMDASRELLEIRKKFFHHSESSSSNLQQIVLPCLDHRECPALASAKDWCHEEVACVFPDWHNQIGKIAGLRKQAILFSYLLFPTFLNEEDQPQQWPGRGSRMVSQLLEQKGRKECWLCTSDGKKRMRISDRKQRERKEAGENLLESPVRGDIFTGLSADPKGEIEKVEKVKFNDKRIMSMLNKRGE